MEIRVYNNQLRFLGEVDEYISLLWNRRYSSCGDFELHTPITNDNLRYFVRGNIVAYSGATEGGVIESVKIVQSAKKNEITVKGRFLESYFDRRLIHGVTTYAYNYSGRTEVAMRTIIQNAVPIPLMTMYDRSGTEPGELHGFTETITFQATYQNLLKYEGKLADSAGFGFRCIPDFINRVIIFDVYKGVDHSESQSERVRVVFSDEYNNIENATYTENDQLLKTICYVGGQGEGESRVWVTVGDESQTGLERREVKLDATDISPDGLSTQQYEEKLQERGRALIEDTDILVKSFECETIPEGNFKYKEHYDLGDIVTLKKDKWGISTDIRITEMQEVYERGKTTIVPTFGNPLPETIDWEDK